MQVYVGTYGKYNSGSIEGRWLKLSDYKNHEDFMKACFWLHKNEYDPEIMFQDWENVPEGTVDECSVDPILWELMKLEDYELERITDYIDCMGCSLEEAMENAEEYYCGEYDSPKDYAQQYAEEGGLLDGFENNPLANCIDWEHYANELRMNGVTYHWKSNGNIVVFNS